MYLPGMILYTTVVCVCVCAGMYMHLIVYTCIVLCISVYACSNGSLSNGYTAVTASYMHAKQKLRVKTGTGLQIT